MSTNNKYIYKNSYSEAIVHVDELKIGGHVKLIKELSSKYSGLYKEWLVGNPKNYKKLTKKQKLELL